MKRALLPLAFLLAAVASAPAQGTPIGIRARIGYGASSSFDAGSRNASLRGPEIAVAFPIGTFLGQDLLLEPSFFGGGRLAHGGDDDADVYRLSLFAHHTFKRGLGLRAGIGYSGSARSRSNSFNGTSDVIFDLGVEIPFKLKLLKSVSPYADVHNVFSGEKELAGFFVGLGLKL